MANRMYTLAEKLRLAGALIFFAGASCLPFPRTNPKSAQSIFEFASALGLVVQVGLITMLVGALLFAVSYIVRR